MSLYKRIAKCNGIKAKGFTLIELVIVIVIVGILAISAAPKFINLSTNAQNNTLNGISAQIESSFAITNSKLKIAGLANDSAVLSLVIPEVAEWCADCYLTYGYPSANYYLNWPNLLVGVGSETDFSHDIYAGLDTTDFTVVFSFSDNFDQATGKLTTDNCYIKYTQPTSIETYHLEIRECH